MLKYPLMCASLQPLSRSFKSPIMPKSPAVKVGSEATVRRKSLQVKVEELQERIRKTKVLMNCVKKV